MDKNTMRAVILSVVIISAGLMIQSKFFPPKPLPEADVVSESVQTVKEPQKAVESRETVTETEPVFIGEGEIIPLAGEDLKAKEIRMETDLFFITYSTKGGVITSLKLKEHKDKNEYLEMILKGDEEQAAFNIYLGLPDQNKLDEVFHYRKKGEYGIEFYKTFLAPGGENGKGIPFVLKKTYIFKPYDYLFELQISVENSVKEYPALDFGGYAYTLEFGPQIGPEFKKLDGRYEYRKYYAFTEGKANKIKIKNDTGLIDKRVSWAAIAGKYFTAIGVPDSTPYEISFSTSPEEGLINSSKLYFSRPLIKSSKNTDIFRFYMGPKINRTLSAYNDPDKNGFGMKNLNLDEVVDTSSILGWLEWLLNKCLMMFYALIPNYGVAIILLTVLIKLVLFPFTKKSYESTSKMQALAPKISELKAKYKSNPQKMNKEMGALYKKEGVNPMGGCLPLLLQMPIIIALFGLLNKHFELRGAVFINGWITDLSSPESIFNFAPVTIPILGWSDIRLLPIIFVLTQLLSGKVMQSANTGTSNSQMKMMTYLMPIMFFFILYNSPSGLLLYWTVMNIITVAQQMVTNKLKAKKG